MPTGTKLKRLLVFLITALVLSITGYWYAWSRGFVIVSATGGAGSHYVIREIPHATGLLSMLFQTIDYSYRMEYWRWPHFIHDCRSFAGDSYRARSARIDYTPERCVFYLDDAPQMTLSSGGEWTR